MIKIPKPKISITIPQCIIIYHHIIFSTKVSVYILIHLILGTYMNLFGSFSGNAETLRSGRSICAGNSTSESWQQLGIAAWTWPPFHRCYLREKNNKSSCKPSRFPTIIKSSIHMTWHLCQQKHDHNPRRVFGSSHWASLFIWPRPQEKVESFPTTKKLMSVEWKVH